MIAIQQSSSALPPTSSHYQPQASSSRPRPNRPNSPTLPPTLHRSPSSSSSSSHLLSLLHPERSPNSTHAAPIPRRLQTSPLILCEASPFHKRSLSSSSSSSSNSPGSSPSPTSRMASLPEVEEEEEKNGALKCNGRSPEEMKRVFEGLLFPREEGARKFD